MKRLILLAVDPAGEAADGEVSGPHRLHPHLPLAAHQVHHGGQRTGLQQDHPQHAVPKHLR